MDALLPQLLSFPPHPEPAKPLSDSEYDKHIKNLVHSINTIPASKLTSGVPGGGDLLDIIDPSKNTIPYLYTLLAHICGPTGKQKSSAVSDTFHPGSPLWQKMLDFMERFDVRQIRYAGTELRRLIDMTAAKAQRVSQPWAAIPPIRSAILRVDESGSTFTSSHTTFAHLCLEARAYTAALPVLDRNIFHFPPATNKAAENSMFPYLSSLHDFSSTFITPDSGLSAKLEYREHLTYFLYGAMILMALKKWKRALLFLEVVIMSPIVNNISKIQVDAYKKWVLVSLLYKGHLPSPLPKTLSQQATKQYHATGKAYDGLADVFKDGIINEESVQRLIEEVAAGEGWWDPDHNRGLVLQVVKAFRQFSVLKLGITFAALTVADVARRTSPDPNDYAGTGEYVIHLISTGVLNATISQPSNDPASWILRFSDSTSGPLSHTEEQQHQHLEKQTRKIKLLMEHIHEADRKLSLHKDYIAEAKKAKKARLNVLEGGVDETTWTTQNDVFEHDEDIMADATEAEAHNHPLTPPPLPQLNERSANLTSLLDHYSAPRNVGKMDKNAQDVGTGLVGAPACGDVMKLQIQVDPATNTISDVKFKTFGCGSAIASSSYLTELVRGMTLEDAGKVRNTEIARELCLPPVKLHCSMLAEDAIKSAISNYYTKNPKAKATDLGGTGAEIPKIEVEQVAVA